MSVLQHLPLFLYGVWMIRRLTQAWAKTPTAHTVVTSGLEGDPAQWPATHGVWTALDERQLVKLLTDSAR